MITVHEAQLNLGLGAELAARITEQCFYSWKRRCYELPASTFPIRRAASRTTTFLILIGFSIWSTAHWPTEGEAHGLAEFRLPDPGEGLVEADIITWRVAVGDEIKINDILLEVETTSRWSNCPARTPEL